MVGLALLVIVMLGAPLPAQTARPVAYVVPIDGGLAPFVDRVLEEVAGADATAVIFEVNTFGGLVDAAVSIRDALLQARVWYAFDSRTHVPRIGRVLMAHGRDVADTALTITFGVHQLASFQVWTDEVSEEALRQLRSSPQDSVISCGRRIPYVNMDRNAYRRAHDVASPRHPAHPGVEPCAL
jgi:hypothetical protein